MIGEEKGGLSSFFFFLFLNYMMLNTRLTRA
jgi:hypothetical protein